MMLGVTSDLVSQLQTQWLSICARPCACHRIQFPTAAFEPFFSNANSLKFSTAVWLPWLSHCIVVSTAWLHL